MVAFVTSLTLLLGTLHGTVTRGPIMPVCRVDVSCDGPARDITLVFTRHGKSTRTKTDDFGRYRVRLQAGTYAVRTNQAPFGTTPQPNTARVVARRDRRVDFQIDTGIR